MKYLEYFLTSLAITFLSVGFSNCASSQRNKTISFEKTPPFTISEIYAQDWVAGVKEGGFGTKVYVTFDTLNEDLKIEALYFANKVLSVEQTENAEKAIVASYKAFSNRDIIMDSDVTKEAKNTPEQLFPFELESDEAVIEYSLDGIAKFFKVSDVVIKPRIAYPAANRD